MIAELDGESRAILRHRRGVMWCPFCDRSRQDEGMEQYCEGCHAKFVEDGVGMATGATEGGPRRRRRVVDADATNSTDDAPE